MKKMSQISRIHRNEIIEYILLHNQNIKEYELETLTIGELVLMKVGMQMDLEKKQEIIKGQ